MPLSSADIFSFKILFTVASCLDKCRVFQDGHFAQADCAFKLLSFKLFFLTGTKNESEETLIFAYDKTFLKAARPKEISTSRI